MAYNILPYTITAYDFTAYKNTAYDFMTFVLQPVENISVSPIFFLNPFVPLYRGVDIWFFPLGSIPLTHCCYKIVDTPFTKTVLDFSRKISKEKNDILLDLQTLDKNNHQYIFSKIKMYDFFHILAFPYIKKEHLTNLLHSMM